MMNTNSTKTISWKVVALLFLGTGLFSVGFVALIHNPSNSVHVMPLGVEAAAVAVATEISIPTPSVGTSFEAPVRPVHIRIPAIQIDANVQSVGLSSKGDGSMGIPSNFTDVAWYKEGVIPGLPGSAVFAGHLDGKNVPEAVFFSLKLLQIDDVVEVIDAQGQIMTFKVVARKVYKYTDSAVDVFTSDTTKARLNLITCGGDWIASERIYNERIVVFTELIDA